MQLASKIIKQFLKFPLHHIILISSRKWIQNARVASPKVISSALHTAMRKVAINNGKQRAFWFKPIKVAPNLPLCSFKSIDDFWLKASRALSLSLSLCFDRGHTPLRNEMNKWATNLLLQFPNVKRMARRSLQGYDNGLPHSISAGLTPAISNQTIVNVSLVVVVVGGALASGWFSCAQWNTPRPLITNELPEKSEFNLGAGTLRRNCSRRMWSAPICRHRAL